MVAADELCDILELEAFTTLEHELTQITRKQRLSLRVFTYKSKKGSKKPTNKGLIP